MSIAREPYLVLESSTAAGSVALICDGAVRGVDVTLGASRDDVLLPAVIALLGDARLMVRDLGAIVCGAGPGSFTSLRIAASIAKGLAHATGCPLFAVSSLLLAAAARNVPGRYLVHADALRGERFALPVTIDPGGILRTDGPVSRVSHAAMAAMRGGRHELCVGELFEASRTSDVVVPRASAIVRVDTDWRNNPVALVTWEPSYGRLAEAQVQWEVTHGRSLPVH